MAAKCLLPTISHEVVELLPHHLPDRGTETLGDGRAVGFDDGEPEGQEVVGDPVVAAACVRLSTDRLDPVDEIEVAQGLQRARGVGVDGIFDLGEFRTPGVMNAMRPPAYPESTYDHRRLRLS